MSHWGKKRAGEEKSGWSENQGEILLKCQIMLHSGPRLTQRQTQSLYCGPQARQDLPVGLWAWVPLRTSLKWNLYKAHTKRCLTSLVKRCKWKPPQVATSRTAPGLLSKKTESSKCWRGCGEFVHCWCGCKLMQPLWKTVLEAPQKKLKIEFPWSESISRSVMSDSTIPWTSLPGSSVYEILQARILEWVFLPVSRGIFLTQESKPHLLHCRWILYHLRISTWSNNSACG